MTAVNWFSQDLMHEFWFRYLHILATMQPLPAPQGPEVELHDAAGPLQWRVRFFDPVVHQLVDTLKIVRPDAEYRDLYWCYQFLTGSMMMTVAETGRIDQLSDGLCHSSDLEAARARLYAYCAAGFEAVIAKTSR